MKDPSFFCENCGKPVPLRANSCPSCGKAFEAVKCPECGFLGKSALFSDGCPSCGYLSSYTSSVAGAGMEEVDLGKDVVAGRKVRASTSNRGRLPRWLYTIITIGLLGVLVLLLAIYLNLD